MEEKQEQSSQPIPETSQFASSSLINESAGQKHSSPLLMYGGITAFCIVILFMGGYILFVHTKSTTGVPTANTQPVTQQQPQTAQSASSTRTPTMVPVTTSNVDQTLNTTDGTIRQTVITVDNDLNDLSSVNSSQDNPNSL